MQTLRPIQLEHASTITRHLLEMERSERNAPSNMIHTMAVSPSALEGYLRFQRALAGSSLDHKLREQIALAVAQTTLCEYSLAHHSLRAAQFGISNDEILASREARSANMTTDAILKFSRDLVNQCGAASLDRLRYVGLADMEIVDIVAQVSLMMFENYFNAVARTDLDAPHVGVGMQAA